MARFPPKSAVLRRLFALSGNQCAFPGCTAAMINSRGDLIGQVCHIEAAENGGERYKESQSDEERRSFRNLVLFCYPHHVETDDESTYSTKYLKKIKHDHEKKFINNTYQIPPQYEAAILKKIQGTLEEIHTITSETKAAVDKIFDIVSKTSATLTFDQDKVQIAQLEMIKELRRLNKHQTAIELLLKYKKENWNKISDEIKYRVIVNLGISYFDLQEEEKGAVVFMELKKIKFESEDSLSYLALASSVLKKKREFTNWFNKCSKINPENANLWIAFINRYEDEMTLDEMLLRIPASLLKSFEILFRMGEMLINQGEKKKGIDYLKNAVKHRNGSPDKIADLNSFIATKILQDLVIPSKTIHNQFTEKEWEELREADAILTQAWDVIKDTELAPSRFQIIMNRGIIRKLIDSPDKALMDLQKAYEVSRTMVALRNLVINYLIMGKYPLADELLDRARFERTDGENYEIDVIKFRSLFLQNQVSEAVALLAAYLSGNATPRDFDILTLLIGSFFEAGLYDQVEPYCEKLLLAFPQSVQSHIFNGALQSKKRFLVKAAEAYDKAYMLLSNPPAYGDIYQLAGGYLELNQYKKAAGLFEKIADTSIYNQISHELIQCYYFGGDLQKALDVSLGLFKTNPGNDFLAKVLINIYKDTRAIDKAINLLDDFLKLVRPELKDAFLSIGTGLNAAARNWDKVAILASQIERPLELGLNDCFVLANMMIKSGLVSEGIELAYKARTKFFGNPDAHSHYMMLYTGTKEQPRDVMFPEYVRAESAVRLKEESGKETVFLITDNEAVFDNKIKSSDKIAVLLTGKKIGDKIRLERGPNIATSFVITEILDKHVSALRESTELFRIRFAGQSSVTVLEAKPGEETDELLSFVKDNALRTAARDKKANEFYNNRQATIGALAIFSRRNVVDQWFSMITSNEIFLYSFSQSELPAINFALTENSPIIIDLTALLTCFLIYPKNNILDSFTHSFIVAQSVVEELTIHYDELEQQEKNGSGNIGFENEKLWMTKTDKDSVARYRKKIADIISWCKEKADVAPPKKIIELNRDEHKRINEILGTCFYDTILLAKENKGVILSDDDIFKSVASGLHGVISFSNYQLAVFLGRNNVLTNEQVEECAFQLILSNHVYIPLAAGVLEKTFAIAAFKIKKPFTTAVKGLLMTVPQQAVLHTLTFAKEIYLNQGLAITRDQIILFLLRELSAHAQFPLIKKMLELGAGFQFSLLQNYKDDFLKLLAMV
jgi:tetratricopeptide (TPR) repeat protein